MICAALLALTLFAFDTGSTVVRLALAVQLACIAWHGWWIWPYTPLHRREVPDADDPDAPSVSIITANVLMPSHAARPLLSLVRQWSPDLLVTLETNEQWASALAPLHADYPHRLACPLDNLYGMHLYSRLPIINPAIQFLVQDDIPSMHAMIKLGDHGPVRVHFLHPAPPSPTENEESTERDAELLVVARSVAGHDGPVIVAGDLNDVAWSATTRLFRKISGLLDPRIGRGLFNTFHAQIPLVRYPLDHIFHSRHFTVRRLRRLPGFGSDHFAMFAELAMVDGEHGEATLQAQADDRALATEKIDAADVDASMVHTPTAPGSTTATAP
ncbi:MAG: endonuclease/exonuclease/phosphatase family protein [Burkholderiaceae bacterium]